MNLHGQIMNLPDKVQDEGDKDEFCRGYKFGHKDARHAAAELANAADAEISRLRDTQRVLVEALQDLAKGFSTCPLRPLYTAHTSEEIDAWWMKRNRQNEAWVRHTARAALASVEPESSRQPFQLNPPPVYDQHYAATQSEVEQPESVHLAVPSDGEVTAPLPLTCWGLSGFCAEVGHKCRTAGECVYAPPAPEQQEPSEPSGVEVTAREVPVADFINERLSAPSQRHWPTERVEVIKAAHRASGGKWPEELPSGVMFYMGERITRAEFDAAMSTETKP